VTSTGSVTVGGGSVTVGGMVTEPVEVTVEVAREICWWLWLDVPLTVTSTGSVTVEVAR